MVSRKVIDMTGQRFSSLVVTGRDFANTTSGVKWVCRCDCGNITSVKRSNLRNGRIKSCGCYRDSQLAARSLVHGHAKKGKRTPTHLAWGAMINRCCAPNSKAWPDYGGRGIKVCDEWRYDFARFLADMGEKPGKEYSLERKNNDGDYCSENCVWATAKEQSRNKRSNHLITYNNKTQCLTDWAKEFGLTRNALRGRLIVRGWSMEKALTTPLKTRG